MKCSACSGNLKETRKNSLRVYVCERCGGLHAEGIYLGDSYSLVKPFFSANTAPATEVYFDFVCLGSAGITRRHGWFNPADGCMTQEG